LLNLLYFYNQTKELHTLGYLRQVLAIRSTTGHYSLIFANLTITKPFPLLIFLKGMGRGTISQFFSALKFVSPFIFSLGSFIHRLPLKTVVCTPPFSPVLHIKKGVALLLPSGAKGC